MKTSNRKAHPALEGFREGFTSLFTFTKPYEPEPVPSVEQAWIEVGEILRDAMHGKFDDEESEKPGES